MSKKFINTIVIFLLAIYGFEFAKYCNYKPDNLDYFDAELLINYSSGFIRRGLLGEIFKYIHLLTNIPVLYLTKIFSIVTYSTLIIYFIITFYKKGLSLFFLLLPSGLFFLLLDNRVRFRDSLLLLLIVVICKIISSTKFTDFYKYLLVSLLMSTGILLHEMFFFYTVPFFFIYTVLNKRSIMNTFVFIFPVAALLCVIFFHGQVNSGYYIFEDLKKIIPNNNIPKEFPNSLKAINTKAESLVLVNFSEINIGFSRGLMYCFFILSLIVCFTRYNDLDLNILGLKSTNSIDQKNILFYFLIQMIGAIPLFFIAVDWQRFINFSVLSSFIFCLELRPLQHKILSAVNMKSNVLISRFFMKENKWLTVFFATVILVPHLKLGKLDYLYTNSYLLIFNLLSKFLYFAIP